MNTDFHGLWLIFFVVVKDMVNKQHHPVEISRRGAEAQRILQLLLFSQRLGVSAG
jgi:hypothetical protein